MNAATTKQEHSKSECGERKAEKFLALVKCWRNRAAHRFAISLVDPENEDKASAVAVAYYNAATELQDLLDSLDEAGTQSGEQGIKREVNSTFSKPLQEPAPASGVARRIEKIGARPSQAEDDSKEGATLPVGLDLRVEKPGVKGKGDLVSVRLVVDIHGLSRGLCLNFEKQCADSVEVAFHFSDGVSAPASLQGFSKGGQAK